MPEVLTHLRRSLFSMYDLEHTDVNIDTTSVAVYGKGTGLYDFGYSRDRRSDLRQVNFGAVELRGPINIPLHLSVDKGNMSDSVQFVKIVDVSSATYVMIRCSSLMPEGMRNRFSIA